MDPNVILGLIIATIIVGAFVYEWWAPDDGSDSGR